MVSVSVRMRRRSFSRSRRLMASSSGVSSASGSLGVSAVEFDACAGGVLAARDLVRRQSYSAANPRAQLHLGRLNLLAQAGALCIGEQRCGEARQLAMRVRAGQADRQHVAADVVLHIPTDPRHRVGGEPAGEPDPGQTARWRRAGRVARPRSGRRCRSRCAGNGWQPRRPDRHGPAIVRTWRNAGFALVLVVPHGLEQGAFMVDGKSPPTPPLKNLGAGPNFRHMTSPVSVLVSIRGLRDHGARGTRHVFVITILLRSGQSQPHSGDNFARNITFW